MRMFQNWNELLVTHNFKYIKNISSAIDLFLQDA